MDIANIKGKAEKLLEWAREWPDFNGYLKLNALVNKEGEASLNVVANDKIIQRFIDGTAQREFTAQFKLILPWSDGYDPTNVNSEQFASSLLDWIDEQYPDNIPDWENCKIYEITTINNAPSLDFVHEQDDLAEYSVQALIRYSE